MKYESAVTSFINNVLLALILIKSKFKHATDLPNRDLIDLYVFIKNGEDVSVNFLGGPNGQVLIHGVFRDKAWGKFKNKHNHGLITEVSVDNPCLMEPYSEVGFRINTVQLSALNVDYLSAIAMSSKVVDSNFAPIDETCALRDTACTYIKKLPTTTALYCIKCK